jgi:hypothetical protein
MAFSRPELYKGIHNRRKADTSVTDTCHQLETQFKFLKMKRNTMKRHHILISTSLLLGLSAFAQSPPVAESQVPAAGMGHMHNPGMMQKMRDMKGHRHAQHLEALKTALKILPEQDSTWTAFASSMKPMGPRQDKRFFEDIDKLTTPERIDKMMAFKAQRDTELNKRAESTKTFYTVLSEDQKKIFDQHTAKFMGKMAHRQSGDHEHMMRHH